MPIASGQKLLNLSEGRSLTINDMAVEQVASAKSLGVYIDQTLNWKCHTENTATSKKIVSTIGAIRCIQHQISFNITFIIALFNLTFITVMRCGEATTKTFLIGFKSFKIMQPAF